MATRMKAYHKFTQYQQQNEEIHMHICMTYCEKRTSDGKTKQNKNKKDS
jgi:hypothetical protein